MAAPTVFDQAKTKRTNRRALVGANGHLSNGVVAALAAAATTAMGPAANNTQLTFVAAQLNHPVTGQVHLLGFGIPLANRPALALQLGTAVAAMDWVTTGGVANLHGEMSVVRYCCALGLTKAQLAGNLFIACVGKPVCADCCGWMTRYNINHGVTCSHSGSSQGWANPLSGANFRGEDDSDFTYSKGSVYRGAATWMNKNPKPW
jgi:hypothetical protein